MDFGRALPWSFSSLTIANKTISFSSSDGSDCYCTAAIKLHISLLFWLQNHRIPNVKEILRLETISFFFTTHLHFPCLIRIGSGSVERLHLCIIYWALTLCLELNNPVKYHKKDSFYGISSPTRKKNYWKFHKNTLFLQDFQASFEDQRWSGSLDETQMNVQILGP